MEVAVVEVEVAVVAVAVAARHLQHQLLAAARVEGDVDREGRLAAERTVDELGRRRPSHRAVAGRAEGCELREGAAAHLWREERRRMRGAGGRERARASVRRARRVSEPRPERTSARE